MDGTGRWKLQFVGHLSNFGDDPKNLNASLLLDLTATKIEHTTVVLERRDHRFQIGADNASCQPESSFTIEHATSVGVGGYRTKIVFLTTRSH